MSTITRGLLLFGSRLPLSHLDTTDSQSTIATSPKTQKKMPDTRNQTPIDSSAPITTEEFKAVLRKHLEEVDDRLAVLYEKREYLYGHKRQLIGYEVRHWESERKEAVLKLERLRTEDGDKAKQSEQEDQSSQNHSGEI